MSKGPLLQSTTAPRWSPKSAPVVFEGRALLLLASVMALIGGLSVFGWRGLSFAAFTLAIVLAQLTVTMIASSAIRRFERRFQSLLAEGKHAELKELVSNAHWVRFFAPRGWFSSREGLALFVNGEVGVSERALELAWASTDLDSRHVLLPLMCRVKFKLERYDDVAILAEDWLRAQPDGPAIWYVLFCDLRAMANTNDTEIAMKVHTAPEVSDLTDILVRDSVRSLGY